MSMIVRVLLASVLAAVVLFVWGFLFWVVLPLGHAALEEEPYGGEGLASSMTKVLSNTGVYLIPSPVDEAATDAERERFERRLAQGPIVRIFYTKTGNEPPGPMFLLRGFLHGAGVALVIAVILALSAPTLPQYMHRVGLVLLVTLVTVVWLGLNEAVWFYHPWKYELYQAGYVLVGGLLMGLVMAAIIKPRPTAVAV